MENISDDDLQELIALTSELKRQLTRYRHVADKLSASLKMEICNSHDGFMRELKKREGF